MRYFLSIFVVLLFSLNVFAADTHSLANTEWQLQEYDGQKASGVLSFSETTAHTQFCNIINQKYSFDGKNLISEGPALSTMMFCTGLSMTLDQSFDISHSATVEQNSDHLLIKTFNNHLFSFKKVTLLTKIDQLPLTCQHGLDECRNVCHRSENGSWACTRMSCEITVAPVCTDADATEKPTICTLEYMPVCGQDGITYGNTCMAGNTPIVHEGECSAPVGSDVDEHGCKASAGYSWDSTYLQCVRPWEKKNIFEFIRTHGITSKTTVADFQPARHVSRQEAAAMLVHTVKNVYKKTITSENDQCQKAYGDFRTFSIGFDSVIQEACYFGLMVGNQGYFTPFGTLTRGQAKHIVFKISDSSSIASDTKEQLLTQFSDVSRDNEAITRGDLVEWIYDFSPKS